MNTYIASIIQKSRATFLKLLLPRKQYLKILSLILVCKLIQEWLRYSIATDRRHYPIREGNVKKVTSK